MAENPSYEELKEQLIELKRKPDRSEQKVNILEETRDY